MEPRTSFVGTPFYVAPEMLTNTLSHPASDLWALGCIIYQMHEGKKTFEGSSENDTFDKIITRKVTWPEDMDTDTVDIIDKLLQLDPRDRLGFEGLKSHSYFRSINFKQIGEKSTGKSEIKIQTMEF